MAPRNPFPQNSSSQATRPLAKAMEHHRAGRLGEAEKHYRVALLLAPRHPDALRLLGALYLQQSKPNDALPLLQTVSQIQPNDPEILTNFGTALGDIGRGKDAIIHFRQALTIDPSFADALLGLGNVLYRDGEPLAALDCYAKALASRPNWPEAYCNMGVCWCEIGNNQQALSCFEMALSLRPNYIDALRNLSGTLWNMGRNVDAIATLERALRVAPEDPSTISKLGSVLHEEGKIDAALEHYNLALTYAPELKDALWGKSLALLALGEYREGWKLFEIGLGDREKRGLSPFEAKEPWDGELAPGKHLLIWNEQGLGDALQFARYIERCRERVGMVSILCQSPLKRLFKTMPFVEDVFDLVSDVKPFDEHVSMMSLPHLFGTVLETVPDVVPYLRIDSSINTKWATKVAGVSEVKIGLAWAGGSHDHSARGMAMDRQRSVGLERIKPWFGLQGARFYSLQKDKPADQIATLDLGNQITDFMGEVTDLADTAAIVRNLDLVIAVDTAVAHLAGALGKPVWILSRYNADWRWLQNRPTNPWYPTARIFGQPSLGDWDSVIAEVGSELAKEIAKRTAPTTIQFALNPFRAQ
jgi:tetratricopeptide (TPR) repeat protein